jgi:AcrR family transcriptional regulator
VANTVALRREARTHQILGCAWQLVREHGIAGLSLHALAAAVGIRQPSLYEYFDSKHALYDAMFAEGNRQLLERLDTLRIDTEPRSALKMILRVVVDFALGIGSVPTTLHAAVMDRFRGMFDIPDDTGFHFCVPLGYPQGNFGPNNRKSTAETTFLNHWGAPVPWN